MPWLNIKSYDLRSYGKISYDTPSYAMAFSIKLHFQLNYIIGRHMISYGMTFSIKSHYMTWHHMTWHHNTPCHRMAWRDLVVGKTQVSAHGRPSVWKCAAQNHSPLRVCLVRASWLCCTLCWPWTPWGSVAVSLKWSTTTAAGFCHSTEMESSDWPVTRMSSIADTSVVVCRGTERWWGNS